MEMGLPLQKEKSYYEIRLESIGGLGANLCCKMLGELAVKYLGFNSTSFSSYGSEKTGTPVKSYIRYCGSDQDIRTHAPVDKPELLVLFHQALLPRESVWEGCDEHTQVLLAVSEKLPNLQKEIGGKPGRFWVVDAQRIAMEVHSRINVVLLGAMAKVMGFIPLSAAENICRDTLGSKYPEALSENLDGIKRGYEEVERYNTGRDNAVNEMHANMWSREEKPGTNSKEKESQNAWGYVWAPQGGINPRYGSTVVSDLSPSRQGYIPVFRKERCINCGFCDSTCPDMVFQFEEGEYQGKKMMVNRGLDYYHCKGCLRCVDVCPVNALVQGLEAEYPDKAYFLPNQEMIRRPDYYFKTGPDGYITSESFFEGNYMEGEEV